SAANLSQIDGEFRRTGPRQKIHGADQIHKAFPRYPPALAHEPFFHHRDVRGRAAVGHEAQAQKLARYLPYCSPLFHESSGSAGFPLPAAVEKLSNKQRVKGYVDQRLHEWIKLEHA